MPGAQPEEQNVAVVILRDVDGNYFVHQRRADKKVFPSRWGAGAGGHIKAGEAPEFAAARELFEETGVNTRPEYQFMLTYHDDTLVSNMFVYEAIVQRQEVGFDNSEWSAARWVNVAELQLMMSLGDELCPDTVAFLERYMNQPQGRPR